MALSFLRARLRALCPRLPTPPANLEDLQRCPEVDLERKMFGVAPFCIPLGDHPSEEGEPFAFDAPTARRNAFRLLRAMQVRSPLLWRKRSSFLLLKSKPKVATVLFKEKRILKKQLNFVFL